MSAGELTVTAPYDGSKIATVPRSDAAAIEQALSTAHGLYRDRDSWIPKVERIAILRRAMTIMKDRAEELALQAAREGGKPLVDSQVEIDRVIDGIVRLVAATARAGSRAVSRTLELGVDGIVAAVAAATTRLGELSRRGDDRGVDGTVEAIARGIGSAGTQSRRLQTGLAHHYYMIAAVGLVVLLGALIDT